MIMQPVALFSLFALCLSTFALAEPALAEASSTAGCIEVRVGEYRAPDFNCLSQQMSNPQGAAAARKNQQAMNPGIDKRAPNALGLATPAATSVRMGNAFGNSVKPQRPPVP
jgi:hypothetical protein